MQKKKYIILIICLILMLGSGVFLISWMLENKNTDKIKKLETRFLSEYKDTYNLDDKILEDNYETKGWLIVDGTNINYPVVQHTDNKYYLEHDFYHNYSSAGWIFMDSKNDYDDQNIVIYGHHRHDDSMFGSIDKLFDKDFYDNNSGTIKLVTPTETIVYTIFSVYKTSSYDTYNNRNFSDFLDKIKEFAYKSEISLSKELDNTSQIITLSTCHSNNKDRLVVHGYKN